MGFYGMLMRDRLTPLTRLIFPAKMAVSLANIYEWRCETIVGTLGEADCPLSMSVKDFKKLLDGNLNSAASYMTGKLKIKGNLVTRIKTRKFIKTIFILNPTKPAFSTKERAGFYNFKFGVNETEPLELQCF